VIKSTLARSKKLRNAARGQHCTVGIVGDCNRDPATTVMSHLPDSSHGLGLKADDIIACWACSACHDQIDGRAPPVLEFADRREWYLRMALQRTLKALVEQGVIQ